MHVSIAMAVRNAAGFLKEALDSIPASLGRSGATYEIVIADGASTDATLAIAEAVAHARIVSRADQGLYDGMNRALAAAAGDAVLLLNGDDLLLPHGVARALDALSRHPEKGLASGAALFGSSLGAATERRHRGPLSAEGVIFGIPAINARLFRTPFLRRFGPIRTDVGLGADRDFLLRLAAAGEAGAAVEPPIYFYRNHEASHTLAQTRAGDQRVHHANALLAADVMTRHATSKSMTSLARASLALERLKLRLKGHDTAAEPTAGETLADLARGLYLAARWRGVMSGT